MEEKNNKKYWIFGGAIGAVVAGIATYFLTSYFVSKNYENQIEMKNKTIAQQTTTIDSLTQKLNEKEKSLLEKINALTDSLKSVTERKNDYQTAIGILCKYLNKKIDVEKEITKAYERKEIKNGEAFRFILNKIPYINPKK
ncbi:MAG: hypothetical protein QW484_01040 [Candidatus Pacearchaeota archaeon]